MNMQWIIDNMYSAYYESGRIKMEEALTEAINTWGKAAVTEQIRAVHGSCKRIVKVWGGSYNFLHMCNRICLDWEEETYITKTLYIPDGLSSTNIYKDGLLVYVTHNPTYNNFNLSDLIQYGEECEECGTIFLTDRSHSTLCEICSSQNEPLPYSTRAEDMLGFENTKEVLFGIELEYEGVTSKNVKNTLFQHAIAKRDGSIRHGVEVVTRPASLKTHKEKLREFYIKVKTEAAENTGMHVHIERSKLSEYQIGFMMKFLNDSFLVPHIEKIAGRNYGENYYCRARNDVTMTTGVFYDYDKGRVVRDNTDKYSPLNTAKQHTVEVRIFSSPESHLECSAKLDFVNALVQYSSPYSINVKQLTDKFDWNLFISFIRSNAKEFPHFVAYYL